MKIYISKFSYTESIKNSGMAVSYYIDRDSIVPLSNIEDVEFPTRHVIIGPEIDLNVNINTFKNIRSGSFFANFKELTYYSSNNYHDTKNTFKSMIERYQIDSRRSLKNELSLIIDELLLNAFFHAPVDKNKKHIFTDTDRSSNIILNDNYTDIRFLESDEAYAVHCKDRYGSLFADNILQYIKKGLTSEVDKRPVNQKGAGIGLSMLYRYSDILFFNIVGGQKTEVFVVKYKRRVQSKIVSIFAKESYIMEKHELVKDGDTLIVNLTGNIDESSDFSNIKNNEQKKVVFNFDKVHEINSCGIREWIMLLSTLKDKEIVYQNCTKMIVDQMSTVNGFFTPKTQIESIYLPYYCEECDEEAMLNVKLKDILADKQIKIPEKICGKCNAKMEFDEIVKQYFNFINLLK